MVSQSPVTICHVVHSLSVGGAELLAAGISSKMPPRFRFVFACLDDLGPLGRQLQDSGVPVHVLHRQQGFDWRCARRLSRIIDDEGVKLLHAHQYAPFFYAAAARLPSGRPAILFTEHGRAAPDYPRRKRIIANRFLLRRNDRVVGVGNAVRKALIENEGLPSNRVEVIHNGIDIAKYGPLAASCREAVRQECELGSGDFVIIHVARIDPLKDHCTAIHAFERVLQHRAEARLLLVGDGPEMPRVRHELSARGVSDFARCLGTRGDVPRLLAAADVCWLTSISEGIPLTLLEAMAAGLPIVATAVGGVAEVVADGETGLLAPAGDDGLLAQHVLSLMDDRSERDRMGQAARQRVTAHFTAGRMLEAYRKHYQEMTYS